MGSSTGLMGRGPNPGGLGSGYSTTNLNSNYGGGTLSGGGALSGGGRLGTASSSGLGQIQSSGQSYGMSAAN